MTSAEYERVGELIYGAQRLDFALSSFDMWFNGTALTRPDVEDCPAEERFVRRAASAYVYFAENKTDPALVAEYLAIAEAVRDLVLTSKAAGSLVPHDLLAALSTLKAVHFRIADLSDQLGVTGYRAESLRERAAALRS